MATQEAALLRVTLFGSARLSVGDAPFRFNVRPKVVPLLAYLVLHASRPVPRDELAFALWPDDTEDAARGNLRRHLHHLREALPPAPQPWFIAVADGVQWNPDAPTVVDVAEFERLMERRESRAQAVALYTSDLLTSLEEEWLLVPRERLRLHYLEALWELATDARLRRETDVAAGFLQRLLVADPWREVAVRELMTVRYESGDRAGALRLFAEFERRLREEMGADPMPETASLRRAIADGMSLPRLPAAHNVPSPLSSFVGRVAEIAEIERRLAASRIVTIVGAGGVGKTRAALLVAGELLDAYEDGVWFVDLALIDDPSLTAGVIAAALRVRGPASEDEETLQRYLARRTLLLVLDNCEHLVDAVARIAHSLLRHAPQIRILATSRQSLGLVAESVYRLPSLSVPAPGESLSAADGLRYDAIALFAARALAVGGGFALTDENAGVVAELCRQLDGIPMAIELAAARVRFLSVTELAGMVGGHLRILVGGDRAVLPRQRTMRAMIDWSYDLLTAPEQLLFDRLSVFVGGFTLETARAVCAYAGIDGTDMLDLLSSLVDKSLVSVDQSRAVTRYRLLEASREYGVENVTRRGEADVLARRHAVAYLELAERLERAGSPSPDTDWAAAVEHERANWIAALAWSFGAGHDVELGQRLILTRPVWLNWDSQPRRWLHLALQAIDSTTPPAVAGGLLIKEAAALTEADAFEESSLMAQRAAAIYRNAGDRSALATALHLSGAGLVLHGRVAEGAALIEEAIATSREIGNGMALAFALLALGHARAALGDLAADRALITEAAQTFAQEQPRSTIAGSFSQIALIESRAENAFASGDAAAALEHSAEMISTLRGLRHRNLPFSLAKASAYLVALNRYDEAREAALEALRLIRDRPFGLLATRLIQGLAAGAALRSDGRSERSEDRARAARLLGFVDARLRAHGAFRWHTERAEWDRASASLRDSLGDAQLRALAAEGERMDPDHALELAQSL